MADKFELKAIISARADGLVNALKQAQTVAKSTRKYLLDVGSAASNLSNKVGLPFAALSGVLGGFSLVAVKNAVVGFTELADAIKKGSLKAGVSTDQYQRLSFVAKMAGVEMDAVGGSFGKLNKNIADAANGGNKEMAQLFKRLGISMRDANGDMRSAADMLPELSDAFVRNKNPVLQARMGMALFGKSWQEVIPLLMEGSEGIQKSLDRFAKLKGVIQKEDLEAGKEFGDLLEQLKMVTRGFSGAIAKELIPVLTPMIDNLIMWAVANKKLISTEVSKMAKDLAKWIGEIDWGATVQGVKDFFGAMGSFVDAIGGGRNALIALVLFMNAGAIVAIGQMGMAVFNAIRFFGTLQIVQKGLWATMMANPIGLLVAAVVGLALIIYKNWDGIVAYVSSAWERIKSVFSVGFFDGLIQLWLEQWQALGNGILGIIKTILPDSWMPDSLKDYKFTFATERAERLIAEHQVTQADGGQRQPYGVVNAGRQQVGGKVTIDFRNAPPGMQATQVQQSGPVGLETNVGYRGDLMGAW